jgi:hypothetical protein
MTTIRSRWKPRVRFAAEANPANRVAKDSLEA